MKVVNQFDVVRRTTAEDFKFPQERALPILAGCRVIAKRDPSTKANRLSGMPTGAYQPQLDLPTFEMHTLVSLFMILFQKVELTSGGEWPILAHTYLSQSTQNNKSPYPTLAKGSEMLFSDWLNRAAQKYSQVAAEKVL